MPTQRFGDIRCPRPSEFLATFYLKVPPGIRCQLHRVLCSGSAQESVCHLFTGCDYACQVWNELSVRMGLQQPPAQGSFVDWWREGMEVECQQAGMEIEGPGNNLMCFLVHLAPAK